jgi:hypothetical protein
MKGCVSFYVIYFQESGQYYKANRICDIFH